MKTRKILLGVVAVVLTLLISIAATIAYLIDVDSEENVFTIGNVDIELLEYERIDTETKDSDAKVQEFHDNKQLLPAVIKSGFDYTPGDTYVDWTQDAVKWKQGENTAYTSPIWDPAKINNEVDKMVFVENTGDHSAYVRVFFAFEAGSYVIFEDFQNKVHLNMNETDWNFEWIPFVGKSEDTNYFVASAIYPKALAPGEVTEITLSQIALDSSVNNEEADAFGDDYSVLVCAQAIQSEGFGAPHQALVEGFGRGIPFDDIYIEGATMKDALRYLDGDLEGENITNKVTSITFGLNNAYPEIADNYQGTPINDGQDYYVNVHYVPNGENYNLYVLADGPIYTPVDSTRLFYNMQSVETIDMANLNTSRTENMTYMFLNCFKLDKLNLSAWDVREVESMTGMFYRCKALKNLNISNWNTESLTYLNAFFNCCSSLNEVDISSLDTQNVTTMAEMFEFCESLEHIIGLDKLDTSSVTDMQQMFNCYADERAIKLTEIDLSAFDSSKLKCSSFMFSGCIHLKTVNFGEKWDMAEVSNTNNMFNGCTNLKNIYVAKDWNTDNLTSSGSMFKGCINLAGGAGTAFDPAKTNKEYARVDGGVENPGYLTLVPAANANP